MRPLILMPAALLLCACSNSPKPDPHTIAPTITGGQVAGRTTLGMPISIPGQSTVLVPFAIESEKEWFQTRDPYTQIGRVSNSYGLTTSLAEGDFGVSFLRSPSYATRWTGAGGSVRWHNVLFRDVKTKEEWPLLDKRAVISEWAMYGAAPKPDQPFKARVLVFFVTFDDTNHDGALNDLDARVAIITDADGRHPRTISPAAAQVWSTTYDPDNDRLYLQVVTDTNADGKFDYNDAPVPYICDPKEGAATPIVSEAAVKHAESMLK